MNQPDNPLEYILHSARHIHDADVSLAFLALSFDLNFQMHLDGYAYLRNAVVLRVKDPTLRMSDIYEEIVRTYASAMDESQVEVAIRDCIKDAWGQRNESIWELFFPKKFGKVQKPANKEFICRIAYFMELWCGCKEVGYETR